MPHMQPEYTLGTFATLYDTRGDWQNTVPAEYKRDVQTPETDTTLTQIETGWFWRLSAPGYMDCTEWDGPYEARELAVEACGETHEEICEHCGENRDIDYERLCDCQPEE